MFDPINVVHVIYLDGVMIETFPSEEECKDWLEANFAPPVKIEWL